MSHPMLTGFSNWRTRRAAARSARRRLRVMFPETPRLVPYGAIVIPRWVVVTAAAVAIGAAGWVLSIAWMCL